MPLGAFGRQIGVSGTAVQNYERGRIPEATVLMRLSNLNGKSIEWWLTGQNGEVSAELPSQEEYERLSRADRRRLEKVEDIFRGSEERTKQRLRAVIDLIE